MEEFPALTRNNQGPSTADNHKEKHIHEVVGVPALSLETLVEDEPLLNVSNPPVAEPIEVVVEEQGPGLLQFTTDEVKVEMDYWQNSVYCFILGVNPPWEIVEGFIRRLWLNHQVDKLSFLPNSVFLVCFKSKAARDAMLKQGHFLFDNKPLIVNPWTPAIELIKHEVKLVPVWVRLHNLPLKFWGKGIGKISGLIGEFIKCDVATEDKTRLGFVQVMIEVQIGNPLPNKVKFIDEHGNLIVIEVKFEWKPLVCDVCKGIGHSTAECRKAKKKPPVAPVKGKPWAKIWKPKQVTKANVNHEESSSSNSTPPVETAPVKHHVEIQLKTPVVWNKSGTYSSGPAPARPIIRLSRQELADGGYIVHRFGQHTFLESLNGSTTPKVDFLDYSTQCINMRVTEISSNQRFFLSMVYAFNDLTERLPLWEQLGGDSTNAEINDFQKCLDRCTLVYSPAIGSFFTWNNKQDFATRVYSRVQVSKIISRSPLNTILCGGKSPYFIPNLINWWKSNIEGTKMFKIVKKLKQLKSHMRRFNKDHFDDIENCTMRALKNLEYIQTQVALDPRDVNWLEKEKQAHEEVKELQQACTLFLSQKAKIAWTKDGDCNINISMESLKSTTTYLLGTEVSIDYVNPRIIQRGSVYTDQHWEQMMSPVTPQEIKDVIFSIPDHKAPGPDGYSNSFFKYSWSVIGNEVSEAIMDVFTTGKLLKHINATTITLIPKCKMPTSVTQFRPIACCNVLYKCISKLLCNRLAKVLPDLISKN
ncbi:uncharacterized protein LOC141639619 [Silene latifolia]|uniref:uncharacterized protein LOC141639619 n=1 Tax=Silene latifolia TaxID=37657 RepID=UPI003D77CE4D